MRGRRSSRSEAFMTITYVVQAGDCLAKIAREHGTTVLAIWNHPENGGHRDRRASPDILYPGDVLRIDALLLPTSPTAGASAPVIPGEPAPTAAVPAFSPWPYPAFKGVWTTGPTWECPGGTCVCHPVPEDEPLEEHIIVFYDPQGKRMPGARCRVYEAGRLVTPDPSTTDGTGELRVELRAATSTVRVEWAPSTLPPHDFLPYRKLYHVKMSDEAGDVGLDRRLANLGFARGKRREDNVRDFQRAYSRKPSGDADEIRLEVLDRHDSGSVGLFHPHEPQGDVPTTDAKSKAFFGSPPLSSAQRLGFMQEGAADDGGQPGGGSGGAGNKTHSGQNVKGSAVPNATDMLVVVAVVDDFPALDPKDLKLRVRPLNVPGMDPAKLTQDVKPIAPGAAVPAKVVGAVPIPAHAIYGFKDIPIGTYSISASTDAVPKLIGGGTTSARGSTEAELKVGLLTLTGVGMTRKGSPFLTLRAPTYATDPLLVAQFAGFDQALPKVALSVTEFTDASRPYFGVRDDEEHFSASTCKSIALFTASLLLMAVRRYADDVGLTVPADKLLDRCADDFRDEILDTARKHASLQPASDADLLPQYAKAFVVKPASGAETSHKVEFSAAMSGALDEMMRVSSNDHSQINIHNTGFGYIHGALVHAGLFDTATDTGLWLAGDYVGTRKARRIPVVNDGDTAQGATTRTFVAMLDMALSPSTPNSAYLASELALSRSKHPSWLTEPNRRARERQGFRDERGKIGDNALKGKFGGHLVFSEILELKHIATGRRFLVSYQNATSSQQETIAKFVFDGLDKYVKATP
jgi:hypothetical protein